MSDKNLLQGEVLEVDGMYFWLNGRIGYCKILDDGDWTLNRSETTFAQYVKEIISVTPREGMVYDLVFITTKEEFATRELHKYEDKIVVIHYVGELG